MMVRSTRQSIESLEKLKLSPSQSKVFYESLAAFQDDDQPQLTAEEYLEKPETPQEYRLRLVSLTVAFVVLFLNVVQSSLYFSSLYPYLQTIDPGVDESFFGWILMAYSLAGAASSPFFGWWTNRSHGSKIPIMAGLALTTAGNFLLVFVESFSTPNRKWIIMFARIVSGIGSGNRGALFAYTVMSSKESERNKILSIRGAITSCSVLLGPGVQAAMVPIGYPGFVDGAFRLNLYTAPGYLSAILGLISLVIMAFAFKETWLSVAETKTEDGKFEEMQMRPYDLVVLVVCCLGRFAQVFCFSFDDTIGSPLTMIMFNWTTSEAVLYNGIIVVVMAFFDIFGQLFVGNVVLKYFKERTMILFGLFMMAGYLVVVFPWPGLPPLLPNHHLSEGPFQNTTNGASTLGANWTNMAVSSDGDTTNNGSSSYTTPCDFPWCAYTTRINLFQYLVAFAFFLVSYSAAYTPASTLFSKALGPRRQGTWQGIFATCSMLGMTFGPPIASNLFQYAGPRIMFGVGLLLLAGAIIPVIVTFKRLVPWSEAEGCSDAGKHSKQQHPIQLKNEVTKAIIK